MDAQKNGQGGNGQKKEEKTGLSWSQPVTAPVQAPVSEKKQPAKTAEATPQANTSAVFRYAVIAVVILAVIGIIWAIAASNKKPAAPAEQSSTTDTQSNAQTTGSSTSNTQTSSPMSEVGFTVPSPQSAGSEVAITNVNVSVPTWVIVYENHNGQPGTALGAALFWQGKTSGTVDLLRNTIAGQSYLVGEARDNGDRMFTLHKDPAVLDANGIPVWVQFEAK